MRGHNIHVCFNGEKLKIIPTLSLVLLLIWSIGIEETLFENMQTFCRLMFWCFKILAFLLNRIVSSYEEPQCFFLLRY